MHLYSVCINDLIKFIDYTKFLYLNEEVNDVQCTVNDAK